MIHVTWDGDNVLNLANVENAFPGDWSFELTLHALEGKTQVYRGLVFIQKRMVSMSCLQK